MGNESLAQPRELAPRLRGSYAGLTTGSKHLIPIPNDEGWLEGQPAIHDGSIGMLLVLS